MDLKVLKSVLSLTTLTCPQVVYNQTQTFQMYLDANNGVDI